MHEPRMPEDYMHVHYDDPLRKCACMNPDPNSTVPVTRLARIAVDQVVMATDPKTGANKELKADRYDLIPTWALEQIALVYGKSCKDHGGKYDANNWRKGYAWGWSFRALFKHAFAALGGEWLDPESGLPHLAHCAWHCLTLMTYEHYKLGTDDRAQSQ